MTMKDITIIPQAQMPFIFMILIVIHVGFQLLEIFLCLYGVMLKTIHMAVLNQNMNLEEC